MSDLETYPTFEENLQRFADLMREYPDRLFSVSVEGTSVADIYSIPPAKQDDLTLLTDYLNGVGSVQNAY